MTKIEKHLDYVCGMFTHFYNHSTYRYIFVCYGYRIQAVYSLDDRLYDHNNKKVTNILQKRQNWKL